jgi:trimeric autotransporter adhesin
VVRVYSFTRIHQTFFNQEFSSMAITSNQIQQLYVAYYGRPADPTGLAYWLQVTASAVAAGETEDEVLLSVSNSFGANAEYTSNFAGLNFDGIINKVYLNLFSHQPDPSGLSYWSLKLTSGDLTLAQIVRAVSESAVNAGNEDGVAYTSKVSAAESFTGALDTTTEILGYTGAAAGDLAKTYISSVNSAATLATAIAPAALAATVVAVTDAGNVVAGQTFMLTTGIDAVPGTAGNDTINGNGSTFTTLDLIIGGAGTDTLSIVDTAGALGTAPSHVSLSSIEVVSITTAGDLGAVAGGVTAVAQVDNISMPTITPNVQQANQFVFAAASTAATVTFTYGGASSSYSHVADDTLPTVDGSAVTATNFAAAINSTAGKTISYVGQTIADSDLSASTPDGHPNSPTCGHLKFPHPERGVMAG